MKLKKNTPTNYYHNTFSIVSFCGGISEYCDCKNGNVYPLAKGYTLLENDDYQFLEKYLDATKANLFFC
jgi:hypothetical protein